jgi:phospholipid/cholesterol/gamma-HCH transport system substrate-binding protein
MKNTLETRLGVFFALALIAALVIVEMIGGLEYFRGGYRLVARFTNIQELKVGDAVKMAGVQIGRVEKIGFANNMVEVTMKVNNTSAEVRTDSKAAIRFLGLMGQNYVSISFGGINAPVAGKTGITELPTTEQADLSTLMAKLDDVAVSVQTMTKNFSGENFSMMLGPFTDFFKQNKDNLTATITNIHAITARIAGGEGTVGMLINEKTLYDSALNTVTNLSETATDFRTVASKAKIVVDDFIEGKGTIGKLRTDETLYKETTATMTNLREISEKINRGQGSVGKLINDESFLKNAKMTLQKLDKATEGLEDQGPLSVIGIMAGKLF